MDEVKDNIKVLVIDTSVTEKSWRWYRSEKSSGNIWIRGIPRREEKSNQEYNLKTPWDKIKGNKICVIGVPEEGEQEVEYTFE